jgi:hypothetical protein
MNKYRARKITRDGITYDSIKEYRRHVELTLLEKAGKIHGLQRQVKFTLIPSQMYDGKVVERPCTYVADFVYQENGNTIVEDVKGYKKGQAYALFTIKRKMMFHFFGIRIKEV